MRHKGRYDIAGTPEVLISRWAAPAGCIGVGANLVMRPHTLPLITAQPLQINCRQWPA